MFESIQGAFRNAAPTIFEPVQIHQIEAPNDFMSAVTSLVSQKRGILAEVNQDSATSVIKAEIPVSEMIGWSNDLRSATEGRGTSSLLDQLFEKVPASIQPEVIKRIRKRKGLSENQ